MAEIKIIGNIDSLERVNRYSSIDTSLVESVEISNSFDLTKDYIEYHLLDGVTGEIIDSNYNYKNYKIPSSTSLHPDNTFSSVEINPVEDVKQFQFNGTFQALYNVFRYKISTNIDDLFIKEISEDRTEIRVGSTTLSNDQIASSARELIDEINKDVYTKEFLLNFGNNNIAVVINVALDTTTDDYNILFKLYEPLFEGADIKTTLWVVDEITEPYLFTVDLSPSIIEDPLPVLRGPNFSIKIPNQNNVSTEYESYSTVYTSLSGSNSYNQITNYLANNSADINIDYTNFEEFIKFGSAKKRVESLYNKVKTIEDYQNNISIISSTPSLVQSSEIAYYSSSISNIISGFDGFESYMYFESSSFAYPKITSTKPYLLQPTGSVQTWYNNLLVSAVEFDRENLDNLEYTVPSYIRENSDNQPYLDFVHMIGHYFDNIWIYLKSITDLYKSNNNLEEGVSKDLVYYALQSLGVNLYNSKGSESLDQMLVGSNSGSISDLNNIPKQDLLAESYKRIYHNIPLLFKSKGTPKGIDQLLNIFGIPDDILSIKEFGGNSKNKTLSNHNNDKIYISSNQITGSVLSPHIRLEGEYDEIPNTKSIDYHRLDVSFSPQNKIDNVLSASIAATSSNFEIDDYIGDPRLETSGSYPSLETLRKSHIDSNFTEEFDYGGFIELVKFFDNSLFKMIKDYTPGRSNNSVGITIRPQHLERIKIKRTAPNFNKQDVYDAEFNGPVISEDSDYLYSLLPNNKAAFYTGELSGSWPDINEDFERTNPNPFLTTTTSSSYQFEHTDFNVTLNNALAGRPAIKIQKLTPIYSFVSGSLIKTGEAQVQTDVQESTLGLKSFINSRYDGTKTISLDYNTYTSASADYEGDKSYGKTASIDKQVRKLGLFSEIVKSKFLPNRNDVVTKYLVDEEGNLTELNQRNKNWEEVQRTFITNDYLNVSLFDNQKYSNQKSLDGDKVIFESGYSYSPILYFSGSESNLYFEAPSGNTSRELEANHSTGLITSSLGTTPDFPLYTSGSSKVVYNIFNNITKNINSLPSYSVGSTGSQIFPSYSVPETGLYNLTASVSLEITMSDGGNVTWELEIVSGSTVIASAQQVVSIVDQVTGSAYNGNAYIQDYQGNYGNTTPNFGNPININGDPYVLPTDIVNSLGNIIFARGTTIYGYNVSTSINPPNTSCFDCYSCNCDATLSNYKTVWSASSTLTFWTTGGQCSTSGGIGGGISQVCGYYSYGEAYLYGGQYYEIPGIYNVAESTSFSLSITTQQNLTQGNKYEFRLKQNGLSINGTGNYIAKFNSAGFLRIASVSNQVNQLPNAIPGGSGFIAATSFISGSVTSSITLNSQLSSFVGYTFIPHPPTGSGLSDNLLYPVYGDVDYKFEPGYFDLIIHHNNSGQVNEYRIVNVKKVNGDLVLDIFPAFDTDQKAMDFRNPTIYTRILFLKRIKDETNTIINFVKRDGKTSYGFIVPENIHPEVFANIDTITREVKTKLLEAGGLDGGTL